MQLVTLAKERNLQDLGLNKLERSQRAADRISHEIKGTAYQI